MTRQEELFHYYCFDRILQLPEEFTIAYKENERIKRINYKIGLRAKIKHLDCFVLYTESDDDLDGMLFIPVNLFYDNYEYITCKVISKEDYSYFIRSLSTINIFELASLLDFSLIYLDFKQFVERNWEVLDMDALIE